MGRDRRGMTCHARPAAQRRSLPCQREVAKSKILTEGFLPHYQICTISRCNLRIPQSRLTPSQPPLTRGPLVGTCSSVRIRREVVFIGNAYRDPLRHLLRKCHLPQGGGKKRFVFAKKLLLSVILPVGSPLTRHGLRRATLPHCGGRVKPPTAAW